MAGAPPRRLPDGHGGCNRLLASGAAELPSKHYHPAANRASPAVTMGIIGEVGEIGGQRLACPLAFERVHPKDPSERRLREDLLRWAQRHLTDEDIAVMDAGVKLSDAHASGLKHSLLRLATNFTACRNQPTPYGGKGRRPVYGEKIRPLERSYKGKTIAASAPDRIETWVEDGVALRAEIWNDLILPGVVPGPQAKTFRVHAIYDPDYKTPWLLATPLKLKPATVRAIYQDRWPVEQIPLAAKQKGFACEQRLIISMSDKTILIDDLIREHYSYVFRLASSILNDQDEAEDAVQETFIRASNHVAEFRGDAGIKTWLSAITINVCRSELRKRRTRDLLGKTMGAIQSIVGKPPDPEDQAAQNDLHAAIAPCDHQPG